MVRRRTLLQCSLLLAVSVLAACTGTATPDPSPSPTPTATAAAGEAGARIAIVVGPAGLVPTAEAAALEQAATALAATPALLAAGEDTVGVTEVRVWRAETTMFARDLVGLAAADGFDLVCLVGTGTGPLVQELSLLHRETRMCTTDPMIAGAGANAVAVGLDPTVLVTAGGVAVGEAVAPVGLLVGALLGSAEELEAPFAAALPAEPSQPAPDPDPAAGAAAAAAAEPDATTPLPGPGGVTPTPVRVPTIVTATVDGAADALVAAGELSAARPSRALVLTPIGGDEATRELAATGTELVVLASWAVDGEGELPGNVRVALTTDWAGVLVAAIEAARGETTTQVTLLGRESGVYGATAGPVPGSDVAAAATAAHLAGEVPASPAATPSPTPVTPTPTPSPTPSPRTGPTAEDGG